MTRVLDAWLNWDLDSLFETLPPDVMEGVIRFFNRDGKQRRQPTEEELLGSMERAGVNEALLSGRIVSDVVLEVAERHPDKFRVALTVDRIDSIRGTCARIEEVAANPLVKLIRVLPLAMQEPINGRLFYPIYERCEALGLAVSINVGIPGPKVRAACQQALFLDDVCIDFPDLVIVGGHMGHPWEDVLIRLMMKYENLYLCNSAYLATYLDPRLVEFMDSSRGRHKMLFATDWPLLPLRRAVEEARKLPLSADALDGFLGDNARRVLHWDPE